MRVSWRYMAAGAGLAVLAAGALTATGQQGGGCCAPPSPPPPPPPPACCNAPRDIVVRVPGVSIAVPSVSVGVASSSIAVAGASATAMAGGAASGNASAGAGGSMIFFGGGGGGWSAGAIPPSTINGLNVSGYSTRMVEEEKRDVEEYCIDRVRQEYMTRPVQAVCVDDRGLEHPASRVDDADRVAGGYSGEVYRCAAGSSLRVSMGAMENGAATFTTPETIACKKGEALWHTPGGALSCRPQAPERNCNERTLLRRHGPGAKLIQVAVQKPYCEPAERVRITKVMKEVREPVALPPGNLVLDGGVGQGF